MDNFICKACANGCNLKFNLSKSDHAEVSGYQCVEGLGYSAEQLSLRFGRKIVVDDKSDLLEVKYPKGTLTEIVRMWGLEVKAFHPQIGIAGSPERTDFRVVFQADTGKYFKLEQISQKSLSKKLEIAQTLEVLGDSGLNNVQPYIRDLDNEYISRFDDSYWQLAEFIKGKELDRFNYVFDGWRGKTLAEFLVKLRGAAENIDMPNNSDVFSLPHYIYKLIESIKKYQPKEFIRVEPVLNFLETRFFERYAQLPVSFCHGDYHPLNIIWGDKDIRAVIDWEFSGYKPEIYDIANLIGCLGMENPESLQASFVAEIIRGVKISGIISDISWDFLLEFVVALRFAWMSEWLRKKDYEMIELEETYMKLLIENADVIKKIWQRMGEYSPKD